MDHLKGEYFWWGMDTDSLIIQVYTTSLYEDLKLLKKNKNKKWPGALRDDLNSEIMLEWIGLKAKCYSLQKGIYFKVETTSRAKGVSTAVKKKSYTMNITEMHVLMEVEVPWIWELEKSWDRIPET